MKFHDSTVTKIARPGKVVNHQASVMNSRQVASMYPQEGVGG